MAETFGQRFDQHTDDIIDVTNLLKELVDREGKYVWKKYEKIVVPYTLDSNDGNAHFTINSSEEIDLSIGSTFNYTWDGSPDVFTIIGGTVTCAGTNYTYSFDQTTKKLIVNGWSFPANYFGTTTADVYVFTDYVVSDNETSYPDGSEQDGYWYERVSEAKVATGSYTTASELYNSPVLMPHGLGKTPTYVGLTSLPIKGGGTTLTETFSVTADATNILLTGIKYYKLAANTTVHWIAVI